MAEVGSKLNIVDIATMKDPTGKIGRVAEVLNQNNPMIEHIPWVEGNLDTGERLMVRTSLGGGGWRRINEGVAPTKSTQTQLDEVTGLYEDWSEVDEKLLKMSGDQAATLLNQARAKWEYAAQEMVGTFLYGNVLTSPKEFHGFFPRLDSINLTSSAGPIVVDCGGNDTDMTSILAVKWGEGKVYGVYPKGSKAGLEFNALGYETKEETGGKLRRVHRSQLIWEAGLAVADYRYVGAIRNIDKSALATTGESSDSSPKLINRLIDLLSYFPSDGSEPYLYVSREVYAGLTKMALSSANRNITTDVVNGKFITHFFGCPVHKLDQFVNEATHIV